MYIRTIENRAIMKIIIMYKFLDKSIQITLHFYQVYKHKNSCLTWVNVSVASSITGIINTEVLL